MLYIHNKAVDFLRMNSCSFSMRDSLQNKSVVVLDSKRIYYSIRISKRAKNLLLHIDHTAKVEVVIPACRKIVQKQIEKFIQEKKRWILRHMQKAEEIKRKATRRKKFLLFLGRDVPIEVIEEERKRAVALPSSGKLIVRVPISQKELAEKAIQRFYKKHARRIITHIVEKKAKEMNVAFSRISIRSQKTLWGSCSPRKVLSFNWRLIAAPQKAIEYIVVHELAHLKHRNHSKAFWKEVQKYCPKYKKYERWLKNNGDFIKIRTDF